MMQRTAKVFTVSAVHCQVVVQFIDNSRQIAQQIRDFAGIVHAWLSCATFSRAPQPLDRQHALPRKRNEQVNALLRQLCAFAQLIHLARVQRIMTHLCPSARAEHNQNANQ